MKLKIVLLGLIFGLPLAGEGQYFQYSQYNFSDVRVNPGLVASSDYMSAGLIFRNQSTGSSDIDLKSSMVSFVYPFLNRRNGTRWSGLGISLMDDRSGGIFTVQEASVSFALNIFLRGSQSLALGFKALYQQRRVNLGGLFTGSQYIDGRGFDPSLFNGESFGLLKSNFATFSPGLYWQQDDRMGRKVAYWGISFFDMNRPDQAFSGIESRLPGTFVGSGGITVYREENFSLMPEFLLTRSAARNVLNIGVTSSYEIKPYPNQIAGTVDLITRYVPGRSGILGLQFRKEQVSIGFSYDFPVGKKNPGNTGAFEIGLEIRRLVDPPLRRRVARRKPASRPRPTNEKKIVPEKDLDRQQTFGKAVVKNDSVHNDAKVEPDLRASLKQKGDSVLAKARVGPVSHEPYVIEKTILHFNFEFNSTKLDAASMKYLDDLSAALQENDHMKVRLTGHTDNIGSSSFNRRLSVYRANVIKQYLIKQGIAGNRITAEGKGLSEPLNENRTETERALNRRVELLIYFQE